MDMIYLEVDEQLSRLHYAEQYADRHMIEALTQRFDACWIYHDLSIEGDIFRSDELERALAGRDGVNWREHQLLEKVRHLRRAIAFVRRAARRGQVFDLEFVKDIHRHLRPSDDESAGRYRKDTGESSAYRHDIVSPKTISYRLRRLVAWVEKAANERPRHPISLAMEIHRELMNIFPFGVDNGIVARLAMNFWIMRHGYVPSVVHVHDRQRYFDCYLSDNGDFRQLVVDSVIQSMDAYRRVLATPTARPHMSGAS